MNNELISINLKKYVKSATVCFNTIREYKQTDDCIVSVLGHLRTILFGDAFNTGFTVYEQEDVDIVVIDITPDPDIYISFDCKINKEIERLTLSQLISISKNLSDPSNSQKTDIHKNYELNIFENTTSFYIALFENKFNREIEQIKICTSIKRTNNG